MSRKLSVSRRSFVKGSVVAGASATLAGCLGGDDDDDAQLEIMGHWNREEGDPTETPSYSVVKDNLINDFEDETGISINYQQISIGDWRTQSGSITGGSDAPDIFRTLPGAGSAGDIINAGYVHPLQDDIASDILDNRDTTAWTFDDGNILDIGQGDDVYGVPSYMSGLPLWYNIPVLEEAGVDHERLRHANDVTWSEFNEICEAVRDETDADPMAFGNRVGSHIRYLLSVALNKSVGMNAVLEIATGESDRSLTDDEFVEAFEQIEEWWNEGFINEDTLSLDEDEAAALFFQNDAAFMTDGIWIEFLYGAVADPDELGPMGEGWDYMWWPYRPDVYADGQNELLGFNQGAFSISNQVPDRDKTEEVSEWFDHFFSFESAQLRGEYSERIPSHRDLESFRLDVEQAMHEDLTASETTMAMQTSDILIPEFGDTLQSEGQALFEGNLSAREVLEECQSALEDGQERYL